MRDKISELSGAKLLAILLALDIGLLTAVIVRVAQSPAYGNGLSQQNLPDLLLRALSVSAPFLGFAFLGITAKSPWLYGIALTVVLWASFVYDRLTRMDANIGMGMLLMASPIIIFLIGLSTLQSRGRITRKRADD